MPTFTVHLVQTVSTAVTVEADDPDMAVELALENAPQATNSTNHGIDSSGQWEEVSIADDSGEEVWSSYPQDELNELRGEVNRLRAQLEGAAR